MFKHLFENNSTLRFKHIYSRHKAEIDAHYPEITDYRKIVWMILNDMTTIPLCEICKCNEKHFIKFSRGFSRTCISKDCINEQKRRSTISTCIARYGVEHSLQSNKIREKIKATNIKRYGCANSLNSESAKKKAKATFLKKYGVENAAQSEVIKAKIKKTNLDRYGVENGARAPHIIEKIEQTNIDRYGALYPFLSKDIRNNAIETFRKKYGVDTPFQSPEIINHIKKTHLKKYGNVSPFGSKEVREKSIESFTKKYDTDNPSKIEFVKEKKKQTTFKHYGVDNPFMSNEIREKIKQTNIERYGTDTPMRCEHVKEKLKQTTIQRYGVDHIMHCKEIRSRIAKSSVVSKPEKKLIELLTNRNIQFVHQYTLRNEEYNKVHTFDFAIFKNDILVCLVEHDGCYFHGYMSDQDGKRVHTDYDLSRHLFIPENVKLIVIIENDFENGIRELFKCLDMDYDVYVSDLFKWCRSMEFPYPKYDSKIIEKSYISLCKMMISNPSQKNHTGIKIVKHFHKSIYHANVRNKISPYDAWNKDELLLKAIKNRIIFKNKIDPSRVLDAFSISKIASKVSVFQPVLAKYLIGKYLSKYDEVFDPFSGFSGRLLGAAALNKKYIGYDLNENHIKESNEIVDFLKIQDVQIYVKNSLEQSGKFECLFTCPPYESKEIWNNNESIKTCDEWIDICLRNFDCKEYLFIVDKTDKYKEYVAEEIVTKSHISSYKEIVIHIIR